MQAKPRVLIIARDEARAGPLADGLDQLGWRTLTARGPYAAASAVVEPSIEAVVLDMADAGADALPMARRLRLAGAPRRLTIIGLGGPAAAEPVADIDLMVAPPPDPAQVASKLDSLVRLVLAEEQFELRRQTFAERDQILEAPGPDPRPPRLLMVGEPSPSFLALSNVLRGLNAEVVAALTAYTAFEYLHQRQFDAVGLWGGADGEALAIASGMRRNSRLFHVPTVLCPGLAMEIDTHRARASGVSDIAPQTNDERDRALRILELARVHRRQAAIRKALERARSSGLMDPATGLFPRSLFASYLARLVAWAQTHERPLSVCVLRLADSAPVRSARTAGFVDRAIPQIGAMIGRLVRVEDTAARLDSELFALALPATTAALARRAAQRIAAVIACTAFEAGSQAPFVAGFDLGVSEIEVGESPARALERAAAEAGRRSSIEENRQC